MSHRSARTITAMRGFAAGVVVWVTVAACRGGGGVAPQTPTPPDARTELDTGEVWTAVRAARDLDGAPLEAHFVAGEPTIFVVFASWCSHCRNELAALAELRAREPRVHVVGLNAYEDYDDLSNEAELRAYVAENAPWLPVVRAAPAWLAGLGGVPKIPSLFVFDGEGRLVEAFRRHERQAPSADELAAILEPLLAPR